jgi:hypothetical protein
MLIVCFNHIFYRKSFSFQLVQNLIFFIYLFRKGIIEAEQLFKQYQAQKAQREQKQLARQISCFVLRHRLSKIKTVFWLKLFFGVLFILKTVFYKQVLNFHQPSPIFYAAHRNYEILAKSPVPNYKP